MASMHIERSSAQCILIPARLVVILFFVAIVVVDIAATTTVLKDDFASSIENITPNPAGLTVASFRYNPTHKLSDWYTSIFGNESVWYNVSQQSPPWMAGAATLGFSKMGELKKYGNRLVREGLNIPDFQRKSTPCSIEILAFGRVDLEAPMMREWRDLGPVLGHGSLQWQRKHDLSASNAGISGSHSHVTIKCYWRALFENWRKQNAWTAPNFWAMLFFCPLGVHESLQPHHDAARRRLQTQHAHSTHHRTDRLQCTHLERSHDAGTTGGVIRFNLTASLRKTSWKTGFTGRLFPSTSPTFNIYLSHHRHMGGRIHKYNGRRLAAGNDKAEGVKASEGAPTKPSRAQKKQARSMIDEAPAAPAETTASAAAAPAVSSTNKRAVRNIFLDEATGAATGGFAASADVPSDSEPVHGDLGRSPHIAVCCIIPYTTNDPDKAQGNGAMLLEWVHYYDKLGFKIFIYDREGLNER